MELKLQRIWLFAIISSISCPLVVLGVAPPGQKPTTSHQQLPPEVRDDAARGISALRDLEGLLDSVRKLIPKKLHSLIGGVSEELHLDYRNIQIARQTEDAANFLDDDSNEYIQEIRHQTRKVVVDGYCSLANWTAVASVISRVHQLDQVEWRANCPIPQSILSALATSHEDCKLFYHLHFDNWDPFDGKVPDVQVPGKEPDHKSRARTRKRIPHNKNLCSLRTSIEYGPDPNEESLGLIHVILATCPNLRELDLSLSHRGCIVSDGQPYAFNFENPKGVSAKSALVPLEILRLSGYRFDEPYNGYRDFWRNFQPITRDDLRFPWNKIIPDFMLRHFPHDLFINLQKPYVADPCDYLPCCPTEFNLTTNVDGWLDHMDFSSLHTLELDTLSSTTLHKLFPHLTSLENLTLHFGGSCIADALPSFLADHSTPLQHLHLSNVPFSNLTTLIQSISNHSTLKTLHLHETPQTRSHRCHNGDPGDANLTVCQENTFGTVYAPHVYLNPSDINTLAPQHTEIEELNIDLDRHLNPDALTDTFKAIAGFKNLSSLTLRLESPTMDAVRNGSWDRWGGHYNDRPHDPIVNASTVQSWFQTLRANHGHLLLKTRTWADVTSPVVSTERSSSLTNLEVLVGDYYPYCDGMGGPDRHVTARFTCSAVPAGLDVCAPGTPCGDEVRCEGGLKWPCEWSYGEWDEDGGGGAGWGPLLEEIEDMDAQDADGDG